MYSYFDSKGRETPVNFKVVYKQDSATRSCCPFYLLHYKVNNDLFAIECS